ncbi:putative F-box protein At3g16210 [Syzygium oleosum]|uniref:putative F-box protein At3g16210 n=1 Tax=Syzygium oleosum TaxID=219896 RepID=UPI0011D19267|nr:putative F-box protein At3g16210 [Syzygium oleosum]
MATPRSAIKRPEPEPRPHSRPPSRAPSRPASSRRRTPSSSQSTPTMTKPRSAINRPEPRLPWRPPSQSPSRPVSSRRQPPSSSPSSLSMVKRPEPNPHPRRPPSQSPSWPASSRRRPPSSSPSSLSMATPRSAIKRSEPEPHPRRGVPPRPGISHSRPPSSKSLPEDIIIELLSRLPVKSLMRFKCVCKGWRSLISDSGFAKWHLQRLKAGDIISSQRILKTYPIETLDYEALDGGRSMIKFRNPRIDDRTWDPILVGSCDGLVCLAVIGGFILYNPTTEQLRKIPISDLFQEGEFFNGFGYDPASDDYKVVVGEGDYKVVDGSKICQVEIFSLKSGSWRRIQVQQESRLARDHQGVYWKGALHWCGIDERRNKRETVIMSFDLSEEKFCQVLPVPEWNGDITFQGLEIHGANLLMYTSNANWFMAWITDEHGRGGPWTKLFSFSTKGIPGAYLRIPIAFTRSGKIIFQVDFFGTILFNPEDGTYKDSPIERAKLAIYVETLVSPYLGCEASRI